MSARIETIQHVLCFDCGLDETYRWSDEARDARDEHNATHHSEGRESWLPTITAPPPQTAQQKDQRYNSHG